MRKPEFKLYLMKKKRREKEKGGKGRREKGGRKISQNLILFLICIHHAIMDKHVDSGAKC